MGNKCCKNQSSTYSSANATIRSFSSYNSSILRSGGSHAITFGTSTRGGDSLTTLTMKSSNHSDVGSKDYQGGSSSTVGQEDLIPIFLRRLNDLNIRVGTRTRLLIELDDATDVQVRWYHNNVEANNERYQYIHEGGFYCLDIVPVTLFDEGLWVCTAQNYAGKSSTAAHLSLTVPKAFKKPIFVEPLKAVLTQRGIVSLECKVIGVPTPKLRWYKDDKEIKAGDIFALTANSEEDCLGIYTCEAANVMGTALSTSKIQVTHTPLDGNHDADSLIPYGPPPKFVKLLKNASGKVGSVLFLECQVEVPPWPRSIGWYNDNGIVSEGPLYHLIADGLGMYGVEIKSLRADHNTTWKCVATSSTGAKAVTSCVVSVSYPKNYRVPRFLESLRAIMTDEGLVSFECKVIGYPTPQLLWFKDGKQLQPGDVYELTGSKSLGSYCCVARNCMGETSSLAELTIEDIQNQLNESEKLQLTSNTQPPRFLLGLKSIEANINESFVFMIKVTTECTPSISWYKEDEQLTESNRYKFSTEDNGIYILNIVQLEIDDQAEWKCVAINKYGQTATSSFLKLNIPKNFKSPRFLEELRIAFSNEGSVNLECKVIGVPQPQLKWFKDGQELNPGDMHKIISGQSGTCCLGTYTCQAHNCMGTVSSSATLLTMEDKSTVKSCASEEYLSAGNPLVRNESLSTIPEERTSQMEKSYTIEEPADISFSFDGKEVTVSLYETPDLTHDEALQIIEMYADELSEHISEDNVIDLPSLRIVKESSISGPVMMEALVIDVPVDFCRQQTVSDTEFDGVSLTEDITLANNDKSESICENSLEYFSDHLSSGNSKREVFYSASETTPKHSSVILKQKSEDDGHHSFQTPKLFMSDSDDQILTQFKLDERLLATDSRHLVGPLSRSESNNTEEEVSDTLAEIDNEPPLSNNDCASGIATRSNEDGLYSTVLNKIRGRGMASMMLSSEEDEILKIISRPNVGEFLKYMKIILEGTMVKMRSHENFNFSNTTTELERSIQALHSLAWKFIEETERNDVTELDKNTIDNVSSLMTAINASLLVLEQIDDPFGVSDNVLNEIQSSVCFDLETFNNSDIPATVILNRLSDQIKNFTLVVNRQVARVTEQRIIAVLRNTIGTTLELIKTLQQNCSKIKCVDINSFVPLFSMVQPLETIINDIANMEEASIDDNKPNLKLKQILIPPISSIAFALDNLNKALKNDSSDDDPDLKDIYDRINDSTIQFMTLASHGMESNKIAECFISFTKPINDLCCYLRRLGRSTENIVSSDYGSDDKLLLDFETLFDELMIDIDTLINNVNFVQDSENNMNPLGSLLEPLQDMKIGLFQVNQVLLSNQAGSSMSFEVMSCFEHLSQQLVQLNNCIVNQSIVEETDKEIPFESSIKMMQNILFDDSIDDLGVNGILFGSVMKPLLQLQNIIVSKMASVESDLSFSEHTDVTGGACDTQSLSISLSHNVQTIFDKTTNDYSKQVIIKSSIIESSDEICDEQNNMHKGTSEIDNDSIHFENNINNDVAIKRGFECDIGETFKYDEPNIITSEDDRENSGFEALFDETDLETPSDFIEDVCSPIMNSIVDHNLSDLLMSGKDTDTMHKKTDDILPEHVLESLEKINQHDLILNSPVDLFNELQETLKNMSEVECDGISDMYNLDNNKSNVNDLQNIDSTYINQICDTTNKLLDDSLDQNFENEYKSINDRNSQEEEQVFEIGQDLDFVEDLEFLDTDKSISNNTIITVDETSDPSEVKMKEIDNMKIIETFVDIIASKTGNINQIVGESDKNETSITFVDMSDKNECLNTPVNKVVSKINDNVAALTTSSDFKNESLDSEILSKLNSTEYGNDTGNNSEKSISQDNTIVNEKDVIHNLGTNATIHIEKIKNENEYYTEKDKQIMLTEKCTNTTELTKELMEKKSCMNPENILMIENHNSSIIEETLNKIKQYDNSDLLNKSISVDEERITPTSMVDINLIQFLKDNNIKGIIEEPNSGNENLSLVESKYNDSGKFETNQDVNLDKKLQHDLQPSINITSITDYKQIVPNCTNCEDLMNPITELNVPQNEENLIKNHKGESQIINDEPACNDQQNPLIIQRNNILQQSNNEVNIFGELKEQCETLSDMETDNEIECTSVKKNLVIEINYPENEIDVRSVTQQCPIDKPNHIDNKSITQYNDGINCVDFMLSAIDMTQTIGSNDILDKQLVVTNSNSEENENIAPTKLKNDVNNIKDSVNLAINEKETATNKKINIHPEIKTTETVVNDEEKSNSTLKTTFTDLKQLTILKNNDLAPSENKLTNNNLITTESTQLIDSSKFDEYQVDIQFKENIDLGNEHNGVLDDKENLINNLENLETKNEIIYFPDEMVTKDEEKLLSEVQYIQNDETKFIIESENIVSEQTNTLICNETISESNIQPIDTAVIDFENIKEKYEKELCVSQSNNIIVFEDKIDTEEKNNQHNEGLEQISNDKLIFKSLDEDNLICSGNKSEKFSTNDYVEIHSSKSIDEKSNPVGSKDDIMQNNCEILKTINNFGTENVGEKISSKLQQSNEIEVDVSSTENNSFVITDIDLKTTKSNTEKVDKTKILSSEITCLPHNNDKIVDLYDAENDLDKCTLLVKENTEDRNICSSINTCIEILNENTTNQHEEFTECRTNISGNFQTLETFSYEKNPKLETVNNEELLSINENNSEINKTSEQTSLKNYIDQKQSKNIIDMCESLENNKVLVNNEKQTISLCDTKLENENEKLTEDSENNQENSENSFEKSFDYKNNLESTENLKNHEIKTEEIKKEFINIKDLEESKIKIVSTIDQTQEIDYTEGTKQKENPTFEKQSNLVINELNVSLENPQWECLSKNTDAVNTNIKHSDSNISIPEIMQINAEVDIIDQYKHISKTGTQNTTGEKNEKPKYVMTKDYSDENLSCKSNLPLCGVQETQESNLINDNKEYIQSKINADTINIKEDKSNNEVKINVMDKNANPPNDFLFESEISDLPAEKSFNVLSITPKLHCVEKIAIKETECIVLENTNILKQGELDSVENVKRRALVNCELNTAVIGNIIMDYDSLKENSLPEGEEKIRTENATHSLTFDVHPIKIVSTNVDILNAPTKDSIIKEKQIMFSDTIEGSKNSTSSIKLVSDNKNLEALEIDKFGDKIENKVNLANELADNLGQTIKNGNQTCEFLDDFVKQNEIKNYVLIANDGAKQENTTTTELDNLDSEIALEYNINPEEIIKMSTENKNIITENYAEKEMTKLGSKKNKSSTQPEDKNSPSPETTKSNICVTESKVDAANVIDKKNEENNKSSSDDKAESEFCKIESENDQDINKLTENNIEKLISDVDENQKSIETCTDDSEKSMESFVEREKTKRGSKKNKSSPRPEVKKSPSPDTTKSNVCVTESKVDTANVIDKKNEENNKSSSDDKVESEFCKIESENDQDINKITENNIEKLISDVDKNQKSIETCTDDSEKSMESFVEKEKTKRGSKKNKSSPRPEVKKSPSPDTTKSSVCVTESKVDTANVIDKKNEENNKSSSDDKVESKFCKIESENGQDINKLTENNIEKLISDVDKNQKSIETCTDDSKKSMESFVEKEKTKRGSKKNKSSPRPEVKKSPSPDTTKSSVCVTESKVDTANVIEKKNEENNKSSSDDKVESKFCKIESENGQDINKLTENNIEKLISDVDKNQKSIETCTDDSEKSMESFVEKEKTKRGSKKNKSSPRPEVKKSPSPDTIKSSVCVIESKVDTANVIDKKNEENNKSSSDDKVESEFCKIESENDQDINKLTENNIEKLISDVDKNQKSIETCTDDSEKSMESFVEREKTKRGSKKNKSSPRPEVKKSPSPDTTKSNVCVTESKVDTANVIDKKNDENNKSSSDDKVESEFCKIESENDQDINKITENNIEKLISDVDKNQKSIETCTDDSEKSMESFVEKEKTKRGSKKNKSSPRPEVKKSPSPDTTKSSVCVTESKVDTANVIDKKNEENNKSSSDDKAESEFCKIESENDQDINKLTENNIEKLISDVDENQKSIETCTDDSEKSMESFVEKEKTKRGSKKNKSSPRPEVKKSPSPDTTKSSVCVTESKVDTANVIDKKNEEHNKTSSDDKVESEFDKTKSVIAPNRNTKSKEIIKKDVSTDNRNEIQKNYEVVADDKIELTNNDEINREKTESSLQLEGENSTCPDIKIINEKLEFNNEIEKKENIIPDISDNFTEKLPNSNSVRDNMKHGYKISSLENKNIDIIGKSNINVNNTDLLTNKNKSVSDCNKKDRGRENQGTSSKSFSIEKCTRTDTTVHKNFDVKPKDNSINCLTSDRKERILTGMTEHDVVDVPEVGSLDKRPVNRYLLDVTDACKLRSKTLVNRSLTPEPLTSSNYRSSYRSLTPESLSYRSSLTPRSKYAIPTRYAGSSDNELYVSYSSSHSSRSSSRCTSPYPSEPRISTQRIMPTNMTTYRCHSETSIPLSPMRTKVETTSSWAYTSYGMANRKRRGSDSFLHDLGVRDGGYYSSWRLSDGRTATHSASEDLYRTKEAFKGLYFCVRMIDQTVSSGARVKFWCSVIGHPEPRVQWYRDGQKLNSFTYNSSMRYQTKYDGGLAQLIVDNAQSGDSGEYTCVASNGRDRISTTGFLTVYTSPSVFRKPLLQSSLSVDGIESGRRLYSQNSHDFLFSINDKYNFGCQKFSGDLTIRRPEYPKFVSSIIADDVATYGGTIALQVRVQGSPVPNVTWMRESRPLPRSSDKYIYLDEGGLYTLLVMDSTARDGGKYVCRACNLYGVADVEKAVRVVSPQDYTDRRGVKPAIIVSRPNDRLNVAVGEDITVTLRVAGEPKPKVIWMRGSRDVTFLDRSLKETVNDYVILSIKKAQPSDAGTYFIIAKNVYGSDRAFVTVGVSDRISSWVLSDSSR